MSSFAHICGRLLAIGSFIPVLCTCLAQPASQRETDSLSLSLGVSERAATYDLRLLPVGDSITNGFRSSDGNGYRLDLAHLLKEAGDTADFIGSKADGENNPDNRHEGFDGYRINQILAGMKSDKILQQRPNLVLLHAGTNDNRAETPGETYADAPTRLGGLVDFILSGCPDSVVLVALLIQNDLHQPQTDYFNAKVPSIVHEREQSGFKIRMVNQSGIGGSLLADGLHPNDKGYQVMAQNWMDAINDLPEGWVTPQLDTTPGGVNNGSNVTSTAALTPGPSRVFGTGSVAVVAVFAGIVFWT